MIIFLIFTKININILDFTLVHYISVMLELLGDPDEGKVAERVE